MWEVFWHPSAQDERLKLPPRELVSVFNAIEKLEHLGHRLPFPHSSGIRGVDGALRELRPRGGASPWRALYGSVGEACVILSICPEANKNRRSFNKAVQVAMQRLIEVEE